MAKAPKKSLKKSSSPESSSEMNRVELICKLMEKYSLGEFEYEKDGMKLRLRSSSMGGNHSHGTHHHHSAPQTSSFTPLHVPAENPTPSPSAAKESAAPSNHKTVVSPFVGTFYRAASPTKEFYVKEGQTVKRGDTLCIIEAMKLMNEIESDFAGKIVSILVENGQPVEFGEPLFTIET
jgi:acetyl-CoA carboxylase biotin carboxyl carrier protein